ncbi:hypothetical protein [Clostridium sp. JS66]|uniref:hypothetical protein n=1 Tax=Clostridium sp. JS66 TaxID=3064705 RepID=UPI00298E06E6|nr:hypothetical protein [Clostridium sp. JS66]WPC40617.1 hypothetical protein Q6H37_22370 [Clostridium sp. JS66]
MEFWLKVERNDNNPLNKNQIFQLPVNPPSFELERGANNEVFETEEGEINLIGNKKLATITFSSFFPAQKGTYCVCTPRDDPYEYVWIIENWMHWKSPVRLIITDTNINMLCSIESFPYKEVAMSRDIEFTLNLREYKKFS